MPRIDKAAELERITEGAVPLASWAEGVLRG